jgi:Ca2+-binding EF-hand superfamily protein
MKLRTAKTLTLTCLLAAGVLSPMSMTSVSPALAASALKTLDPDKDGTVDLNEAKTAASALFDKLEKDNDGTLDRKELHGRIPDAEWAVADPDNDKTISKDEYLAYVETVFKKVDTDNDGTLDAKELKTPAGHALVRLLMK